MPALLNHRRRAAAGEDEVDAVDAAAAACENISRRSSRLGLPSKRGQERRGQENHENH
jgi:hypothetical protein